MKFSPHRLKYNIWLYFILFALGLLCIVWFIQVVFTEQYFLNDLEATMITTGKNVELQYSKTQVNDNDEFLAYARKVKEVDNIHVIITTKNYNGEGVVPDKCYPSSDTILAQYYDEYGDIIRRVKELALTNKKDGYEYLSTKETSHENSTPELCVYSKILSANPEDDADPVYLVLISSLDHVNKMLALVQQQFGYASIVVVVIAFFISLLIASSLANPLVHMTKTAKKLAKGDFSVEFAAKGYTETQELSDTLNYMKEELKKTSILQRELMANVTHDLKTPLTMVKAYAEMIKDISGDNKEKRDKHAQIIIDEADRLTMLVNDILNLSKVQSSVDGLSLAEVDLSALTNKVVDHFSSFSEKNGYTIKTSVEAGLYVECDVMKIEQVIYNLIGNAINYTGENKTIEVFLSSDGDKVLFEVIDSGKGIDEDKIDTIWDKYYRASETHKRPVKGTGLGLSIVKAVLDAHNLKYGVVSRKNVGSNFFVEFKLCKEGKNE